MSVNHRNVSLLAHKHIYTCKKTNKQWVIGYIRTRSLFNSLPWKRTENIYHINNKPVMWSIHPCSRRPRTEQRQQTCFGRSALNEADLCVDSSTFVCFVKPRSWCDISRDFGYNWFGVVYLNMVGWRYCVCCVVCLTQSNTTWFSEVPAWRHHFVILTVSVSQQRDVYRAPAVLLNTRLTKSQRPCQKAHNQMVYLY